MTTPLSRLRKMKADASAAERLADATQDPADLASLERHARSLRQQAAIYYQANLSMIAKQEREEQAEADAQAQADESAKIQAMKPKHAELAKLRRFSPTTAAIFAQANAMALRLEDLDDEPPPEAA